MRRRLDEGGAPRKGAPTRARAAAAPEDPDLSTLEGLFGAAMPAPAAPSPLAAGKAVLGRLFSVATRREVVQSEPNFDDLLAESLEDRELREKLLAGRAAMIP